MRRLILLTVLVLVGCLVEVDFVRTIIAVAGVLIVLTEAQVVLNRRRSGKRIF